MRRSMMLVAALATLAAAPAHARTCHLSKTDAAGAQASVRALFAALAKDDRAAYQRAVTTDFWTFDAGQRMTANELFDLVEGAHRKGRVINWSIGPVAVRGDCNMAWASWENDGAAGTAGAMAPRRWLESAVLRRTPGGWRVEFLHSTSVNLGAPKPH
jgi:ketosteroid isomerase-like protein